MCRMWHYVTTRSGATRSVYSNAYSIFLQDEYEVHLIIYMNIKTNKMSDQELELLCAEEEIYVQAWRSSLTEEQLNQLNEYIA